MQRYLAAALASLFIGGSAYAQRFPDSDILVTEGTGAGKTLDAAIRDGDLAGGAGDVTGPATSIDGNAVVFSGVTGKTIDEPATAPTTDDVLTWDGTKADWVAPQGGGGTYDPCSGATDYCFVIRDDGGTNCPSAVAGDLSWTAEGQCMWNDSIQPVLDSGGSVTRSARAQLRIILDWPHLPVANDRIALTDTVKWCISTATGDAFPDCSTGDQSILRGREVILEGPGGQPASFHTRFATPTAEPGLDDGAGNAFSNDIGLWIGEGPATASPEGDLGAEWENGLRWRLNLLISTDQTNAKNSPVCATNAAVVPLLIEGGELNTQSVIGYNVLNLGTCQASAHNLAPPVILAGVAGGTRGDIVGDALQIGEHMRTPIALVGPDRGFQFVGDWYVPPTAGFGQSSIQHGSTGYYNTVPGRWGWRDGHYKPVLRLTGPGLVRISDLSLNALYLHRWEIGEGVVLRPTGIEPFHLFNSGATGDAFADIGTVSMRGEIEYLQSLGYANLNPVIRHHSVQQTTGDAATSPRYEMDGTITRYHAAQWDKGVLRCPNVAALSIEDVTPLVFFGPRFTWRPCNDGIEGVGLGVGTGRCPGSAGIGFLWPHYLSDSQQGLSGRNYCPTRAHDGGWDGAFLDYSAAGPPAQRVLHDTTGATIDMVESTNVVGFPAIIHTGAGFDAATICAPGGCLDEPRAFAFTKGGVEASQVGSVSAIPNANEIVLDKNSWAFGGSGLAIDYKVQVPLCYEPRTRVLVPCDDPNTEMNPRDSEYWFLHDQRVRVHTDPEAGTSCLLFWTKNGRMIGQDYPYTPYGSNSTERLAAMELGSAELDSKSDPMIYEGITGGFEDGPRLRPTYRDVLRFRVMDGPNGRCLDPDFSLFPTHCTIAAGGSQHVSQGGACGAGAAPGDIHVLTDAFDENDCQGAFAGGGGTDVFTQLVTGGTPTTETDWACAPANTGTKRIGAVIDEVYTFTENVIPFLEDEICDNGQDDDGDRKTDADDPDCP